MRFLFHALITIAILIAAATLYVWSGRYNVAATSPHWNISIRLIQEARDRSITFHSRGIHAPPLKHPDLLPIGFDHYHAMCRLCHGAPGYAQTETAQGLNPQPPKLTSEGVQGLKDAELYWVVKNGIKMTGMPAFGPTHEEDELWGIVAFLRDLPKLSPGEYKAMARAAGVEREEENHHHHDSKKH